MFDEVKTQGAKPQPSPRLFLAFSFPLWAVALFGSSNKRLREPCLVPRVAGGTVVQGPDPVALRATSDHAPEQTTMQMHRRAGSG